MSESDDVQEETELETLRRKAEMWDLFMKFIEDTVTHEELLGTRKPTLKDGEQG